MFFPIDGRAKTVIYIYNTQPIIGGIMPTGKTKKNEYFPPEMKEEKDALVEKLQAVPLVVIKAIQDGKYDCLKVTGWRKPTHKFQDDFARIAALKYVRKTLYHFATIQLKAMTGADVVRIWERGYIGCLKYLVKNGRRTEAQYKVLMAH